MYVMALAKEEESQTTDPITNGWKVVDFMLGGARETL